MYHDIQPDTINKTIVPILRSIAAARRIPVIDCNTPLLTHPEYFSDGVHPGADTIASVMYRAKPTRPGAELLRYGSYPFDGRQPRSTMQGQPGYTGFSYAPQTGK